jgi:hypothetical protein
MMFVPGRKHIYGASWLVIGLALFSFTCCCTTTTTTTTTITTITSAIITTTTTTTTAKDHYSYSFVLEELKLHTLHIRRHRLDALFFIQVYIGLKFCPSVLEIVGLRVPARYIRDFALFSACTSCKNCPSARCASAANFVCRDVDVFEVKNVRINSFL